MTLNILSVPALAAEGPRNAAPPGRPDGPGQRMQVPGQPQAEVRRPEHSPGRVPVGSEPPDEEAVDLLEDIERRVKSSKEYQILRPLLHPEEERGQAVPPEDKTETAPPEAAPPAAPAQAAAPAPVPVPPAEAPPQSAEAPRKSDPLAFDLDGNGLETTGLGAGVLFDIDADGHLDRTSFVGGNDAFLALDRNGNGRIDDGGELFGDQHGDANGYAALARYDDNSDGVIDRQDAVFNALRLFRLATDGSQQLTGLAEAGIARIDLGYRQVDLALNAYDTIAQLGRFERDDGSSGTSGDLLLGHRSADA